jgi:2-dehydropantoate 2-reductase
MPNNKIMIVGAGAVGGYFGALLSRSGQDVTFLVRPQTALAISKAGLAIKTPAGDFTVHPPVIEQITQGTAADLIILAVKCTDLPNVLPQVAPLVEKGAILLTLQNGVDSEERIRAYFEGHPDCVVAGVAYITARLAEPGVIEHYRRGTISIGERSGEKSERVCKIHEWIAEAGISCKLTDQILKEKWEKLCWNATFNPLSVILDAPLSLVLKSPELLKIVQQGIHEILAVAKAEGFSLHPNIIESTLSVTHSLQNYYTSMYEDYKKQKPTEIEHLNGDIIRRGEKHGIPTPTHQTLYALIKGLELKQNSPPAPVF